MSPAAAPGARRARERYALVALMVVVITLLHYQTSFHLHELHGIYRRLYYFPIIFAAFLGGRAGGLITAALVCALYAPHAFGLIGRDPAPALEKTLEMALYLAVGLVTGVLVSREARVRADLQGTARGLELALREKAAMEAQLVRSARLAAVGRLSAGLAHEIRNPLASIQGAAEVLADDYAAAHPKRRLFEVLLAEASRLNGVLSRFLEFARPRPAAAERVDVAAEAAAVLDLARHRPGAPRLAGSGEAAAGAIVAGDREQVRQLLLNLVLNAVEAAGSGGRVAVGVAREGALVVVTVDDDGPGFTPEALDNFGAPFFTTRPGGTGLGLAICHRIVEDHGGRIGAVNREGGGARVRVELRAAG